jgi:hypothetical protein
VASHIFQDLGVSSGKKGKSLPDPCLIWQGSGTEVSRIFPRDSFKPVIIIKQYTFLKKNKDFCVQLISKCHTHIA